MKADEFVPLLLALINSTDETRAFPDADRCELLNAVLRTPRFYENGTGRAVLCELSLERTTNGVLCVVKGYAPPQI